VKEEIPLAEIHHGIVCMGVSSVRRSFRICEGSAARTTQPSKYKLDLLGEQEVRWEDAGTEPAGEYTFFNRRRNENHELCTVSFCA
jgi:hypothetical protein